MKRSKKGFTLIEIVFAIGIAVLVSIAAASVVLVSRSSTKQAERKNNAVCQAGAVIECFKASENLGQFKAALEFTYDKTLSGISSVESDICSYIYFDKHGKVVSDATDWNFTGLKDSSYFAVISLESCNLDGTFKTSTSTDNGTTCQVYVYESAEFAKSFSDGGGTFNPFKNLEQKEQHTSELVYEMNSSYKKGSAG